VISVEGAALGWTVAAGAIAVAVGLAVKLGTGLLSLLPHPVVQPNGQMLPLRVWRCGVCKAVQLVEDDV